MPKRRRVAPRRPNPNLKKIRQGLSYVLYDRETPAGAAGDFSMFSTPKGTSGKTFKDTNMLVAGQLPAAHEFDIQAIGFTILGAAGIPPTHDVLATFLTNLYMELNINSRPQLQLPGPALPLINQMAEDQVSDATGIGISISSLPRSVLKLTEPLHIGKGENFDMQLVSADTALTGFIYAYLFGKLYRPGLA
ncbi:MAG: hypothetical protein HN590_11030 [Calditrichaeota bacterium]|nr:hypothetical protein [Calditrichota bacterium]